MPTASRARGIEVEFVRDARVWCAHLEEFLLFAKGAPLDARLVRVNPVRRVLVLGTLHGTLLVNVEDVAVRVAGASAALELEGEGVGLEVRASSSAVAA